MEKRKKYGSFCLLHLYEQKCRTLGEYSESKGAKTWGNQWCATQTLWPVLSADNYITCVPHSRNQSDDGHPLLKPHKRALQWSRDKRRPLGVTKPIRSRETPTMRARGGPLNRRGKYKANSTNYENLLVRKKGALVLTLPHWCDIAGKKRSMIFFFVGLGGIETAQRSPYCDIWPNGMHTTIPPEQRPTSLKLHFENIHTTPDWAWFTRVLNYSLQVSHASERATSFIVICTTKAGPTLGLAASKRVEFWCTWHDTFSLCLC